MRRCGAEHLLIGRPARWSPVHTIIVRPWANHTGPSAARVVVCAAGTPTKGAAIREGGLPGMAPCVSPGHLSPAFSEFRVNRAYSEGLLPVPGVPRGDAALFM